MYFEANCDRETHPGISEWFGPCLLPCGGVREEAMDAARQACREPALTSGLHRQCTGIWALELDRVCFLLLEPKSKS